MSKKPYKFVSELDFMYGCYKWIKFRDIPTYYLLQEMNKGMFDNPKYTRNIRIKTYIRERVKQDNEIKKEYDPGYVSFD